MDGLTESGVQNLNVNELKAELSKRNLPVSGKKADLVQRLVDDLNKVEANKEAVGAAEETDGEVANIEDQMDATEETAVDEQMDTTEVTSNDIAADDKAAELINPLLEKLSTFKPPEWQLKKEEPQPLSSLDEATHTIIDTTTLLNEMVAKLNKEKEIGVALLHSPAATFLPTTYVLQLSTRSHDYIVDVEALRDEVNVLNEIMSDENVLKVMSRQNYDLEVLAESCGIWIINLFDIWTAGRMLDSGLSQHDMLRKYCSADNIPLDKSNDWSVRPLSEDQLKHARHRVRYLLYLYEILRNQLIEKKILGKHYDECTKLCKHASKRGTLGHTEKTWKNLYKRNKKAEGSLDLKQQQRFGLICKWGFDMAKKHNTSLTVMLPISTLFNLAKKVPQDAKGVAELFPDGVLPPNVDGNMDELLRVLRKVIIIETKKEESTNRKARGGRGRPGNLRGTGQKRGSGTHPPRGSGSGNRGRGMGHMRPGMGPMEVGMGPMGPGMDPMGVGMGPMGFGMGPMWGGMGTMGPGMGPMWGGMGLMGPGMGPMGAGMGHMNPSGLRDFIGKFVDQKLQSAGYEKNNDSKRRGSGVHRGRARGRAQRGGTRGKR